MQHESICASIGEKTFAGVTEALKRLSFAEIRLDLSSLDDDETNAVFACGKPLIATCRKGVCDEDERLGRLLKAVGAGAAYVDVETENDDEFIKTVERRAKACNCKMIVSFHDFETTPPTAELIKIVAKCRAQGADIVKLVTTANTTSDAARVLSLYDCCPDDPLIAFAMGEKGLITRAACVFLGAPYTYAAVEDDKPVAPGQISLRRLRSIFDNLKS